MTTSGSDPEGSPTLSRRRDHTDFLDVGAFIRNQRELAKLSVRRLAELAEVSNPYLSQIERGLRKPSAEILQQVAHALRISVETLYVRAGILSDDDASREHRARGDRSRPDADARAEAGAAQRLRQLRRPALSRPAPNADPIGRRLDF